METLAWSQKGSKRCDHCAAYNQNGLLSAEKRWETHIGFNQGNEEWIVDYVNRETAVASKQVWDADTAIMQEQDDRRNVQKARSTTTKPETRLEEMLNGIGNGLSNVVFSTTEEYGEQKKDDEEDTALGKLSGDDQPGRVMGTISKTVQHCMESLRRNGISLDELTQNRRPDAADNRRERHPKYRTTELMILALVKPGTDRTAATPSWTTFGVLLQTLHIVSGQSQMPQVVSQPGRSRVRL